MDRPRTPAGAWQRPAAAPAEPPSPAELYAALMADFGPEGWEIRFTGAMWEAFRPGFIALHAPSAIALRDAIDVAKPRPLTGPAIIPASRRLLRGDE